MKLFKIRKPAPSEIAVSIAAGIIISVPLCTAAAVKWQKTPDNPYCQAEAETEPETETQIEVVRTFRPYEDLETQPDTYYSFIPLTPDEQAVIYTLCERYEIAYGLMLAVAKTESGFDMAAVGASGDKGMFQINEFWSDKQHASDLPDWRTDIKDNTELALRIMTDCLEYAGGDLEKALNYYNSGSGEAVYYTDETTYAGRVFGNYQWILEQEENGL